MFFPRVYSLGVPIKLRFNPKGNIRDPRERFAHGMNVAVPYWNKYYSKNVFKMKDNAVKPTITNYIKR